MNGGLVGLQIERKDPGDRGFRQPRLVEHAVHQGDELARIGTALAAHAHGERARMVDEVGGATAGHFGADRQTQRGPVRERQVGCCEPRRGPLDADPGTGKERAAEGLHVVRVGEVPALGRRVEGDAETKIPSGGDGGASAERAGDGAREIVGAAVAAEERNRDAAILGDGDDRRLAPLIGEHGRQCTDQHAGRAHADDRRPRLEKRAHVWRHRGDRNIRSHPARHPMQLRSRQYGRDTPSRVEPARAENEDCRHRLHDQASPRRCTSTMEK